MNISRETAMAALFNVVKIAAGFVTTGRRLQHFADVPASMQPALFQVEHGEHYAQPGRGLPGKTTLEARLILYARAGDDPNAIPAITLNTLLDAIDAALKPDPTSGAQTLGGVVSHCWIEGEVFKDPGDLDGQAVAVVPVKILVP